MQQAHKEGLHHKQGIHSCMASETATTWLLMLPLPLTLAGCGTRMTRLPKDVRSPVILCVRVIHAVSTKSAVSAYTRHEDNAPHSLDSALEDAALWIGTGQSLWNDLNLCSQQRVRFLFFTLVKSQISAQAISPSCCHSAKLYLHLLSVQSHAVVPLHGLLGLRQLLEDHKSFALGSATAETQQYIQVTHIDGKSHPLFNAFPISIRTYHQT